MLISKQDSFFFFFQAEDGIRDLYVTGVQTCALPICHVGGRGDLCRDLEPGRMARRAATRDAGIRPAVSHAVAVNRPAWPAQSASSGLSSFSARSAANWKRFCLIHLRNHWI